METRELVLLVIIIAVVAIMVCRLGKVESFYTDYSNYPREFEPGNYSSWGSFFYSAPDRANNRYKVMPGIISNDGNKPFPYNVHTGQTIQVAHTDGIKQIGCPIDFSYEVAPDTSQEEHMVEGFTNEASNLIELDQPMEEVISVKQNERSNLMILGLLLLLFVVAYHY